MKIGADLAKELFFEASLKGDVFEGFKCEDSGRWADEGKYSHITYIFCFDM